MHCAQTAKKKLFIARYIVVCCKWSAYLWLWDSAKRARKIRHFSERQAKAYQHLNHILKTDVFSFCIHIHLVECEWFNLLFKHFRSNVNKPHLSCYLTISFLNQSLRSFSVRAYLFQFNRFIFNPRFTLSSFLPTKFVAVNFRDYKINWRIFECEKFFILFFAPHIVDCRSFWPP